MQNILIANGNSIIRYGLTSIISREIDYCICYTEKDLNGLFSTVEKLIPDLLIMDIYFPETSGLYIIKDLKTIYPEISILLIGLNADVQLIKRCISAGASGYLNINTEPDELLIAIKSIMKGSMYIGSNLMNNFFTYLSEPGSNLSFREKLSDREFEIFRLMGEKKTSSEIADILSLSIKTISTYKSRIQLKLNLNSSIDIYACAMESNFNS